MDFGALGRLLVIFGLVIAAVGLVMMLGPRIPWLGKLPGDIILKKGNFTVYFPLATSLLLSLVLSLLLRLFGGK